MEAALVEPPKRRGRKRKAQNVNFDLDTKKKAVVTRSLKLVGRYVQKEFEDNGLFLGKITSYVSGLYRINYEDGDFEDLDSTEVKGYIVEDGNLTREWARRKAKLDEFLLSKDASELLEKARDLGNVDCVDSSTIHELTKGDAGANEVVDGFGDGDVDADCTVDSLSDSCEESEEAKPDVEMKVQLGPPPELPPSSGHIGVPDEYVSHLFSVYSFLRSFSLPLFLYPFGLDDFVGALKCSAANTLLDSIHVAVMRLMKRHLERLSTDGSELAVRCLRYMDWSLLDTLTWPVYLAYYLILMGHMKGPDWKDFYNHCLESDYYNLPAGKKLVALQMLCEDVLDSEEVRAEIDAREESEGGIHWDESTFVPATCGPRKVHPRYSKTAAYKNMEGILGILENREIKVPPTSYSMEPRVGRPVVDAGDDEDGNGDDCRLCGMDGFLVCCDGCPFSYHSRCLGMNKTFMPDGSWFCPECKLNATEPEILRGTSLVGGYNFGIDPYEQHFVASCDHLLVLEGSVDSRSCLRYYKKNDIPGVIRALYAVAEHANIYSDICRGIMQYWELPSDIFPCKDNENSEVSRQLANGEGSHCCYINSVNLDNSLPDTKDVENAQSSVACDFADISASCAVNCAEEEVQRAKLTDTATKPDWVSGVDASKQQSDIPTHLMLSGPSLFKSSISEAADPLESSQQSTSTPCAATSNVPVNGSSLEYKSSLHTLQHDNRVEIKGNGTQCDGCLYMGSSFKTTGYINHYLHGEFAASAAANLAMLSSEENQVSDKGRKFISASVSIQTKAFSSAAIRFFWPNTEKKLAEVPRERCSWCFTCKATVASKRGCLLNAAALNAIKGAIKFGVPIMKTGDERLSSIATYILFMEDSLRGLLSGPFLNDSFRKLWRKQVEQAATCNELKILLIELEENIRTLALTGEWTKLFEGSSTRSSTSHVASSAATSTQKRKPGRRGRKPAIVEVPIDDSQDTEFTWWRGGKLSKLICPRAILPCSIIRKSARLGGSKNIPFIYYVEGHGTPKYSRQLAWRSAVEMSRNIAYLALQVRYLDSYVKWADLVRPEQTLSDGKGTEAEASAFRNAFICDKRLLGIESRYSVTFNNQKHLPSRIMKNIIEVEKVSEDGTERYWFSETRIPLYLIKEYGEEVVNKEPINASSKLQRWQLKAFRQNIFSSLLLKRDNLMGILCNSCHQGVFYRYAVKCNTCQGICHAQCSSGNVKCRRCYEAQAYARIERINAAPISPMVPQGQHTPNQATMNSTAKSVLKKVSKASVANSKKSSKVKSTNHSSVPKTSKKLNWGLIWRKNNVEDTGSDFRSRHVLMSGNPNRNMIEVVCRLCSKPYNPDLLYIRCETCQFWFHADAVELHESKIFDLVGFKCCKCRRIRSPMCPYMDPEKKNALLEKMTRQQATIPETVEMDSDSDLISGSSASIRKPEDFDPSMDYDPFASLSEVNQFTEMAPQFDYECNDSNVSCPGPQKLPVRRHSKQQNDAGLPYQVDPFQFGITPFQTNVSNPTEKLPVRRQMKKENKNSEANATNFFLETSPPQVQWPAASDDGAMQLDYDSLNDTEFEPQTYFSFNELLASDDGGAVNCESSPANAWENWENGAVVDVSYDHEEPMISIEADMVIEPCKMCSNPEPCADLCCQVCGMWIHSYCSPWVESSSYEDGWRCGNCRHWR